jgi:multidrug efflux pump subunit AcrA (membrane-fusion protein)
VNVAPSVNVINKKVEVKISVDDSNTNELVVGQNVTLSISTDEQLNNKNNNYSLPIQNVKIIPGDAFVYTLDSESKIVKNPVVLGKVQGDFVEIISGINPDMMIVTPVYEIEEGEEVVVQ